MASKPKRWTPKKDFKPGGEKGKLHREIGVPEGEKIPAKKLHAAAHSSNPEIKRDAIRAETMKKWKKRKPAEQRHPELKGRVEPTKPSTEDRRARLYDRKKKD
jgi:hypothetical protein